MDQDIQRKRSRNVAQRKYQNMFFLQFFLKKTPLNWSKNSLIIYLGKYIYRKKICEHFPPNAFLDFTGFHGCRKQGFRIWNLDSEFDGDHDVVFSVLSRNGFVISAKMKRDFCRYISRDQHSSPFYYSSYGPCGCFLWKECPGHALFWGETIVQTDGPTVSSAVRQWSIDNDIQMPGAVGYYLNGWPTSSTTLLDRFDAIWMFSSLLFIFRFLQISSCGWALGSLAIHIHLQQVASTDWFVDWHPWWGSELPHPCSQLFEALRGGWGIHEAIIDCNGAPTLSVGASS